MTGKVRQIHQIFVLCTLAALSACASTGGPVERTIERNLRGHIETLSSEEYGGRFPGTQGEELAVSYQIDALKSYGYEPGYIGEWTQQVTLERSSLSAPTITIGGKDTAIETDDMYVVSAAAEQPQRRLELVIVSPDFDGDFSDLSDKAVLIDNLPPGADLFSTLLAAEPGAIIVAVDDQDRLQRVAATAGSGRWGLAATEGSSTSLLYLGPDATSELFETFGKTFASYDRLLKAGEGVVSTGQVVTISIDRETEELTTSNVLGRLPGTKPGSGGVILLAHWDHLGDQCGVAGDEDRLCNGAVDNASGVGAMLEAARIVAKGPRPERDVYIMGNTAEELGLLGARAFVNNPPVPLDYFVAGFSLDTLALAPRDAPLTIIGYGLTPLDEGIKIVAERMGRQIDVREEDQQFARRHDGWALTSAGIPAPLVSSAFGDRDALNAFMETRYHDASDEYDDQIELGGVVSDVPLYVELVRYFGDTANYMPPEKEQTEGAPAE